MLNTDFKANNETSCFVLPDCGGNLTQSTGELTHPAYPHDIQNTRAFCTWKISLEPGTQVSLLLNHLALEESQDCSQDFLEVREEDSSGLRSSLKKYCGHLDKPERLVSSTNEIEVVFQSNSSSPGRRFLVTYSTFLGKEN